MIFPFPQPLKCCNFISELKIIAFIWKTTTHRLKLSLYFFPDAARELEEGERKKKPNCFALGPVFDNFARRTYYISCGELLTKLNYNVDHLLQNNC